MKSIAIALIALCITCGTTPAAERPSVSVTHAMGTVSIQLNPERVVVLDYGTLDTLDVLNLKARLALPKRNLPGYLAKFQGDAYTDIGGLREFNLETINAFRPELIIISGRQQDYYRELSSIAPVLLVSNLARDYVASTKKNLDILGKIFAVENRIETEWKAVMDSITRVREHALAKKMNALVLLTNDGKISAYGSGSRFGIIYDELGVSQADPGIKAGIHGQLVNYEYIALVNPDIIFVVDRSTAVGSKADNSRILDNTLVAKTNAAKNNRIMQLPPDIWYLSGGGLRSLAKMVEDIGNALDK